jgi:2-dehydro-3-deoxyglucarate aldolase
MRNIAKQKLQAGETIVGAFVAFPHPDVCEWLAHLGFDWLILDMEHGPLSFETVQRMIQAMKGTNCAPLVRPPSNNDADIKRALDLGAFGIVAPMVNTREDAERAVKACRYPPRGVRGFGPRRPLKIDPDYLTTVEGQLLVMALLETVQAIDNAADIMSVEGIDAGVIGPFDLSYDMGFGAPLKWNEERYVEAYRRVVAAARVSGKAAGAVVPDLERVPWLIEMGHRAILVGEVDSFILRGAKIALDSARNAGDG